MKIIKAILSYIMSFLIFIFVLFILFKGSLPKSLNFFSNYFVYFNLFFSSIYFFIVKEKYLPAIYTLIVCSILLTVIISELIVPSMLKGTISYNNILENFDKETNEAGVLNNQTPIFTNYLEKAEYYLKNEEFSSAWIYADIYIEKGGKEFLKAESVKNNAVKNIKKPKVKEKNIKYIDNLVYQKLIKQNRPLDIYYFCLNSISSNNYDYDLLVKFKNSYKALLNQFYSINHVKSKLNLSGFNDIKFYSIDGVTKFYSIEKIVKDNDEFYIKNLTIDNKVYEYLYINKAGKIFANGFDEDREITIMNDVPYIPVNIKDLRYFSEDYYGIFKISIFSNIKALKYNTIKYFKNITLVSLVINNLCNYLSLIVIFFMALLFVSEKNYFNFLFEYCICFIFMFWLIKKTGLILANTGLSLSVIILFIIHIVWIIIMRLKLRFSPSQF